MMSINLSDVEDDLGLVRELVRSTIRGIHYHERGITQSHKQVATAQSLIERLDIPLDREAALALYERDEDDEAPMSNAAELAQWIFGKALFFITYHEDELKAEHQALSVIKMLILRGQYEVSVGEIEAEMRNAQAEGKS